MSAAAAPDSQTNTNARSIRVALPYHLRNLAHIEGDVLLNVTAPVTLRAVLDALEARYPMLRGTIRDYESGQRRAFLRFFACAEDISLTSPDAALPEAVASGKEPLLILGAIAGG
jgi:molybdopterin synthase sulfur carrier subunit